MGVPTFLKPVENLYSENVAKFGYHLHALGWNSEESHWLRFSKLLALIEHNPSYSFSVNDLGCGFGCLFRYLQENRFLLEQYYGYDISPEMIKAAKQKIKSDNAQFILSHEITQSADYSFASGIFNVRLTSSEEFWQSFMEKTLLEMAEKSKKGMAFNVLSTYVDWRASDLYYANPSYYFEFCKKNITKYVILLHDYDLYEWTMLLRL